MKRGIYYLSVILILFGVSGCGAKYDGTKAKESYKPRHIAGATAENSAIVKVAGSLYIWKVDGVALVGKFKRHWQGGRGPDSINIEEGKHTIYVDKKDRDYDNAAIRNIELKRQHQYLIAYEESGDGSYYILKPWVEDLTENKVVYGKKPN